MALSPAVLSLAVDAKCNACPSALHFLQNPYFGIFMLLFVGSLMASRLPTISLKSIHIERAYLLPVMVGLLLLIAFLVSNFWLTIGVVGALYIFTVPATALIFVKARNRYERQNGEQAKAIEDRSAG